MNFQSSWKKLAVGGLAILAAALMITNITHAQPPQGDRWIHVKVEGGVAKTDMVNVNLPISLAVLVLSSVDHEQFHHGHVSLGHADLNGVDLRAILDAVRNSPDGEFVTVKNHNQDVHVAKQNGFLVIHVIDERSSERSSDRGSDHRTVEVRVPISVCDAMLAAGGQDLDVAAGLKALAAHGDTELVTVKDGNQTVHIWIDSKSTMD
jgi:hypothetical protein